MHSYKTIEEFKEALHAGALLVAEAEATAKNIAIRGEQTQKENEKLIAALEKIATLTGYFGHSLNDANCIANNALDEIKK